MGVGPDSGLEAQGASGAARAAAVAPTIRAGHGSFVEAVRAEVQTGADEASFRLRARDEMMSKGYAQYLGGYGDITAPVSEVNAGNYRYHLEGEYVSPVNQGATRDFPRLYIPEQARDVYSNTFARRPGVSDIQKAQVLVRFYESVNHLANIAGVGNFEGRQRLVMANPGVAELLMRAAVAREMGIGRTGGRKGAYAVEYMVAHRLPQVDQLVR